METRKVFKYPVYMADRFTIAMPKGAEVLSVQLQFNSPQIWALVEPRNPVETRSFCIVGTGRPMPYAVGRFIGTFQTDIGSLVWHLFEAA